MSDSITTSKKRSRPSEVEDSVEGNESNQASSSSSSSKLRPADEDADDQEDEGQKKAMKSQKRKKKSKDVTPGIVYISRLPPGMTPQKVRHLMGRWGEIGKVYAQRRDAPTGYNPNSSQKKQKHQSANYSEAWVEFLDKSVAKTVSSMLNAQVIGGKKGDKWRDDIWTMKYLSGFKWEMLGEQMAYERQAHQARLRTEITRSKAEQSEYLKNVELARVLDKRKAKKALTSDGSGAAGAGGDEGGKGGSSYRQRPVIEKSKTLEGKGMDDVLGSIFG
ncbi:uncharacterized protein I303_104000 [Kwoniella dejecticola CBS 10117]|uniref:18S rRNA factor 2 n=1 Tax=Kwoniella dejecticola CBS 10117 TaxID=1296121 RepID=A0A1A6A8A3_9TREE|nr:pre-rRNA-processing protein ESF2 [Kwoniella dejecticola CBS 10117]OBR86294.1 pre-rRNA-processing protein ESF2 [Kwoniella dejecticola CBS 10117]